LEKADDLQESIWPPVAAIARLAKTMNCFNRYILTEIIKLFLIALIAFTSIIILFGVTQQLMRQGLGLMAVIELLPYVLPVSLQYALPATLLFAVCSVYGRISADSELLAVMAVGIPPAKFISSTLVLATIVSLAAVWLNDIAYSWGKPGINRVVLHSIEEVAYRYLKSQGSYSADNGFSIHVHGIGPDGRELILPTISTRSRAGGESITIEAQSARLRLEPEREELVICLTDSIVSVGSMVTRKPGSFDFSVQMSDATKKATDKSPANFAMRQIGSEIQLQLVSLNSTEELLAARSGMALAIGKYEWLSDEQNQLWKLQVAAGNERLNRLRMEPWRRWASGFSCLFFVWLGVPLSIWMKSADYWTSFGTCFLPTVLMYYPVFTIGLKHARDGSWTPASVWLGNLALLIAGAWWMRRIYRTA
jgi:lipopolysaccharide export system permease protein